MSTKRYGLAPSYQGDFQVLLLTYALNWPQFSTSPHSLHPTAASDTFWPATPVCGTNSPTLLDPPLSTEPFKTGLKGLLLNDHDIFILTMVVKQFGQLLLFKMCYRNKFAC